MSDIEGIEGFVHGQQIRAAEKALLPLALNAIFAGQPQPQQQVQVSQEWAQAPDGSWHWITVERPVMRQRPRTRIGRLWAYLDGQRW